MPRVTDNPTWDNMATSQGEAAYPDLWPSAAWSPALAKPYGSVLWEAINNRDHGVLTNMAPTTDWIYEEGDWALKYNGAGPNNHVAVPTQPLISGVTKFSMVVWSRRNTGSVFGALIGQSSLSTNRTILQHWSDGIVYFAMGNGAAGYGYFTLSHANWFCLAIVYDGTQATDALRLKMYVDGVQQTLTFVTGVPTSSGTNSAAFNIGFDVTNLAYTSGAISTVLLYDRCLADKETLKLSDLGATGWAKRKRPSWYGIAPASTNYTATVTGTVGHVAGAATATFTAPVYTGQASCSVGHVSGAATATFTTATYSATCAVTAKGAVGAATATFSPGTKTASAAVNVGPVTCVASATFSPGTKTATAAVNVGHVAGAATATFTSPVYTATAGCLVGHVVGTATATFNVPIYSATAALTVGPTVGAAAATFVLFTNNFNASAALTIGHVAGAASCFVTNPTYSATCSVTVGHTVGASTAIFANAVYSAQASCLVGHIVGAAAATYTSPTRTCTAAVSTAGVNCAAVAAVTGPIFTSTVSLATGDITCASTAVVTRETYHATVTGIIGGVEASIVADFDGSGVIVLDTPPHLCDAHIVVPTTGVAYIRPHNC